MLLGLLNTRSVRGYERAPRVRSTGSRQQALGTRRKPDSERCRGCQSVGLPARTGITNLRGVQDMAEHYLCFTQQRQNGWPAGSA